MTTDTNTRPDGTDPSTSVDQLPGKIDDAPLEVTTPEGNPTTNVAAAVEAVASHLHPTPSWDVEDHPVPVGREEVWRFTPLKRLRGLHADAAFQPSTTACAWNEPSGVTVRPVDGTGQGPWRGLSGYVPTDRLAARMVAEVPSSLTVDVASEAVVAEPVVITMDGSTAATTEAGCLAFRVGAHARVTIVLRYSGSATMGQLVELVAGDGSDVTLVTVQDWADDTVNLNHHSVSVGRDAHVRHIVATLGGDVVRQSTEFRYDGPGGALESFGVYFVDAGQHVEHRLFVDHNAPRTRSDVDYRGALQGKGAHSVWVGDVLIRKVAEGIETYEANKNLVLTDGCQADSVPNLEIETGEIAGAGHSSTTGRFDENHLFYLRSRGIPEDEARRLVVHGFFVDIIRRIGVADVEERLLEALEAELRAVSL